MGAINKDQLFQICLEMAGGETRDEVLDLSAYTCDLGELRFKVNKQRNDGKEIFMIPKREVKTEDNGKEKEVRGVHIWCVDYPTPAQAARTTSS